MRFDRRADGQTEQVTERPVKKRVASKLTRDLRLKEASKTRDMDKRGVPLDSGAPVHVLLILGWNASWK